MHSSGGLKFFSDFYASDIIIASPLGLKTLIGKGNTGDTDFLSSIELVVLDMADLLLMQNWEHVESVMDCLNGLPKTSNSTDFSRLRSVFVDGCAGMLRQTVLLSSIDSPDLAALVRRQRNVLGRIKVNAAHRNGSWLDKSAAGVISSEDSTNIMTTKGKNCSVTPIKQVFHQHITTQHESQTRLP